MVGQASVIFDLSPCVLSAFQPVVFQPRPFPALRAAVAFTSTRHAAEKEEKTNST